MELRDPAGLARRTRLLGRPHGVEAAGQTRWCLHPSWRRRGLFQTTTMPVAPIVGDGSLPVVFLFCCILYCNIFFNHGLSYVTDITLCCTISYYMLIYTPRCLCLCVGVCIIVRVCIAASFPSSRSVFCLFVGGLHPSEQAHSTFGMGGLA